MHQNTITSHDQEKIIQEKIIIEKIKSLPVDRVSEIINFIDFISQKNQEHKLLQAAGKMSEDVFKKVWDNSEDSVYDRL
ncbi:MAG: toxin-antitoxin system, antitoxin component, Xre family protein [Desulfamplus sp.]|nr:toxin-antitoxin system, antitoxin component, Xre family protein [Desulfamplus sp.]